MNNSDEKNYDEIVELLVRDYQSKYKSELAQKIGKITQDFISRHFFNSTARIGSQFNAEFEYINKLIDYVIDSLEKSYGNIPLEKCKNKLLDIVDSEYKKLIPQATSMLVQASLYSEGAAKSFEKRILDEMQKSNERIETQCALATKRKLVEPAKEKWYQNSTIQAAIISGISVLIAALITSPYWISLFNSSKENNNDESVIINETKSDALITKGIVYIEPEGKEENRNTYESGSALTEIFKADSFDMLPALPIIRTYWNRDLAYSGGFPIPERALELGQGNQYVARFSFYYEAKEKGKYGFSVAHYEENSCKLVIGDVQIFHSIGRIENGDSYSVLKRGNKSAQGVCNLEEGFHRIEFYLFSEIYSQYRESGEKASNTDYNYKKASFQLKVLSPDSFDAVPITKDMMFLKKE